MELERFIRARVWAAMAQRDRYVLLEDFSDSGRFTFYDGSAAENVRSVCVAHEMRDSRKTSALILLDTFFAIINPSQNMY